MATSGDLLNHHKLCYVDMETTGTGYHNGHRMVSLCACIVAPDGSKQGPFEILINPDRPIPWNASQIHNLYDMDVMNAPLFATRAAKFAQFCEGSILVAHNARGCDEPMLRAELTAAGVKWPFLGVLDTLPAVKKLWPEHRHKLSLLVGALGGTPTGIHTAKGDVLSLMFLVERMLEKLQDKATLSYLDVRFDSLLF